MVNTDERARRSSPSPEPRPEHISDSSTSQISEDGIQSLNPERPDRARPGCTLFSTPPDRSPQRNEQEVSSDSDSFHKDSDSHGQSPVLHSPSKEIDRSKGYRCPRGWVLARSANFGKGKEFFIEYKEKFRSLYEEMMKHPLLVENVAPSGRVDCAEDAMREAIDIVLEELKKEDNYELDPEYDNLPYFQFRHFIGFDMIKNLDIRGAWDWVPDLEEQPLGENLDEMPSSGCRSPPRRQTKVREGPLWAH